MKLSEYFQEQKKQQMKTQLKNEIFFRIQKEKLASFDNSKTLTSKRFHFASKKIHYISLASLIVLFVFGGFFFEKYVENDFGLFSVRQGNVPNGVMADYVAEIVDFNGEYSLIQGDEVFSSSVKNDEKNLSINNGDVIKLQEGAEMIFSLTDGTQARIDGPAEFSIVQENDSYKIYINDGKFFRIYCPECQSDIDIITPELSIHQEKDQKLDLQLANDEGETLVKNNGDLVSISTKNKDNKIVETKISNTESVSIDSKNDNIDVLGDSDLMETFMVKNNISGTFTLSMDPIEWPDLKKSSISVKEENKSNNKILNKTPDDNSISKENEKTELESSLDIEIEKDGQNNVEKDPIVEGIIDVITSNTEDNVEIDENITQELGISNSGPQIPSESQTQILKTNLNSFFLMNTFEDIYTKEKMSQGISNLAERINAISKGFGYSDYANADLSSIKSTINSLKSKLQKDRYIAPSYVQQLEKIMNWCDELSSHASADVEDIKESRNNLQTNLPYSLKLM